MTNSLARAIAAVCIAGVAAYFAMVSRRNPSAAGATAGTLGAPPPSHSTRPMPDAEGDAQEDAIREMLDAAQAGDAKRYLAGFAGDKEAELRRTLTERGVETFVQGLRATHADLKGFAIRRLPDGSASHPVYSCDLVFADHNEALRLTLRSERGAWKIDALDRGARSVLPSGFGSAPPPLRKVEADEEDSLMR